MVDVEGPSAQFVLNLLDKKLESDFNHTVLLFVPLILLKLAIFSRNVDACPVDKHLRLWQKVKLSASAGLNFNPAKAGKK